MKRKTIQNITFVMVPILLGVTLANGYILNKNNKLRPTYYIEKSETEKIKKYIKEKKA